jgi:hypothetical protein
MAYENNCGNNSNTKIILEKSIKDNVHGQFLYSAQILEHTQPAKKLDPEAKKQIIGFFTLMSNEKSAPVTVEYVKGRGKHEVPASIYNTQIPDILGQKVPTPKDAAKALGNDDTKHIKLTTSANCVMRPTAITDVNAVLGKHLAKPAV